MDEERTLLALIVFVVVLAFVPVDLAAEAHVKHVEFLFDSNRFYLSFSEWNVGLGEHFVCEVLVVLEVVLQCESV